MIHLIDTYIKKAEHSLQESQRVRLEAKELLETLRLEYLKQVEESDKTVKNAQLRAENEIKEATIAIQKAGTVQLESLSARMKKEEADRMHQLSEATLKQVKKVVIKSLTVATKDAPVVDSIVGVKRIVDSMHKKNLH